MQTTQLETTEPSSTDYTLRLLIDRLERMGRSECEIEVAVRDASDEGER